MGGSALRHRAAFAYDGRTEGDPVLVLSRKVNQRIMIGDDIEIVVVDIRGEQVQIGIKAPRDIPVHRLEVYDTIRPARAPVASS